MPAGRPAMAKHLCIENYTASRAMKRHAEKHWQVESEGF